MTRFLLDRNVLGELEDPNGDRRVHVWADGIDDADLFLCAITIFEAQKGFSRQRRAFAVGVATPELDADEDAFAAIRTAFAGRILAVGEAEAIEWGRFVGAKEKNLMDRALAAVARVNGMVLATRNLRDMRGLGVRLLDPFRASPVIEEPVAIGSRL